MHIPDGFLDLKTSAATGALAAGAVALALYRARRELSPKRVPLLGLAAAFIFAGQMLNFPVAGGTSGHLVGSVLAAVLLGPSAAVIALTAVLLVQCFVFADGGVLALGANIFNMGVVGAVLGYGIYRLVRTALGGRTLAATVAASAFAAWCATVLAAICCAAQLAASGTAQWRVVFPAMTGVHMVIGVGEAIITGLVVFAIGRARPEMLEIGAPRAAGAQSSFGGLLAYGIAASVALAAFVSPFASKAPDGLDRVAETHGFFAMARQAFTAPFANYTISGVSSATAATSLAGVIGTAVVFAIAFGVSRVVSGRARRDEGAKAREVL